MSLFRTIVIEPLKLIFEFIYAISYKLTGSAGISIAALSFVLNILLLPLYKKADAIQEEENAIQRQMKPDIDFIKKTFSGNEQFMILQTYYRQFSYKPIYVLRSSVSLLLQIPFFIAAYSFLSNLQILNGASFGPFISDLSKPDGLLFGLNLFPIAMTLINIISCIVYTKGQPLKSQMQLYAMALVFLVLLYNAPSALSFYYLLNNLFSLVKNVLAKIRNRKTVIPVIILSLCGIVLLRLDPHILGIRGKLLVYGSLAIAICLCLYALFGRKNGKLDLQSLTTDRTLFLLSTVYLFILTGLLIPNSVIASSPEEFINKFTLIHPLRYVFRAALLSFGLFVLWFNIFYALLEDDLKRMLNVLMWILAGAATLCYMVFNIGLGTMSNALVFDAYPSFSGKTLLLNLLAIAVLALICIYLWIRKTKYIKSILSIMCIASLVLSCFSAFNINRRVNDGIARIQSNQDNEEKILPFSKTEKNVVVLMLDRAINYYFPYILNDRPELQEQFAGFTYYPNTISFGAVTNVGAPGLFGGYEYIPEEMNKRDSELLVDKHNESLKVMPVLFNDKDYRVVVCDPPYAGYTWIPDLSIFDGYDNIKAYMTEGKFLSSDESGFAELQRNLFVYSLARICPSFAFGIIYDDGHYLNLNIAKKENEQIRGFRNWFDIITHLDYISYFTEDDKGTFMMMQNSATHEPLYLSEPDYTIDSDVDQSVEDAEKTIVSINGDTLHLKGREQVCHYHVNVATMIELGKWFDFLRENGVYDNKRIIIVSDHARNLYLNEDMILDKEDLLLYNCLLLYKDFNSDELMIDVRFMTNADTPYLAMKDLIEDLVNPFTGKEIVPIDKTGVTFNIFGTRVFDTTENNGTTFIENGRWFSVHDNCLDINNWTEIEVSGE